MTTTHVRWLLAGVVVAGIAIGAALLNRSKSSPPITDSPSPVDPQTPAAVTFEEITQRSGVQFRHEAGATPNQFLPEVMGAGMAWLDVDRDGFPDLFLVQSGLFPPDPKSPPRLTSMLFHNNGDGTFTNITMTSGLRMIGYGQGVAVGDYDNDGFPDLFVSHYHGGQLFHNEPGEGGRRFRDVTKESGLVLDGWCGSAAFGDLHGNGRLDLFVCRYLAMDPAAYPSCVEAGPSGPVRSACGPQHFEGTRSFLFRNDGNGRFTDVSQSAGLEPGGKALGVVIVDLDGDGKADIFVGNDEVLNHHYRNLGGGKFRSVALRSGTGATHLGRPMGSMGIEAGDLSGSGLPDLFVTTYIREGTVLFRNRGGGLFTDVSTSAGMFAASWDKVGWGTALFDADNDGCPDLFVANGHTRRNAADLLPKEDGKPQEYAQKMQLFMGDGKGVFREASASAGSYFGKPRVGRGVAKADFDNDGRTDLAVTHVDDVPALLRNSTENANHWIALELEGAAHSKNGGANRDAIGAIVTVRVNGRSLVRHVIGGGSYYSSHDRRLLVGLGEASHVDEIVVRWPNDRGDVQRFGPLEAGRGYRLREGIPAATPLKNYPSRP